MKLNFLLLFIILLTVFSFLLRLNRYTQPRHYYFDEVYHAVTAKAYADNNPAAYDPFAPAPMEGTAYEWLHPPLAKLIQAGSIKIFGDNPVGWRTPSLIIGTAIIPAVFLLAYLLFGPMAAIFASTVIAFENLTFAMSRIAMNDVFITFFTICAFIFMARYLKKSSRINLVSTALFLGLAVSSKWTGFYTIGVIFLIILIFQFKTKRLSFNLLLLIVIPFAIYLLSYGQFWLQGHTASDFINLNKQIWWYQNRHDLVHSYGTTPIFCVPSGLEASKTICPWILDTRGVYFSYEDYGNGRAGYIYALGNPFIFWAGIVAISYILGKYLDEKNHKLLIIILGYFIFWIPWIFTPRLLFLYHYLPSIPFLAVALGIALKDVYKTKFRLTVFVILALFIGMFFFMYPISSGLPIKINDIDKFMLLKSWR